MYQLFVDSDCDISKKLADEYGAKLISMPYLEDNKEIFPYETWEEFDSHAFYEKLRKGELATTFALNSENYKAIFEPTFKEGKDILYAHFSAAMTCTFDNMRIAIKELLEKYPERKFYEIDAKGITIGAFSIVREIMKMYKAGKSIEEIKTWADVEVDKYAVYFFADNLKFFKRSGRVSGFSAIMGNLIGIKPIIYMNSEGKMVSIGKAKGRANAIKEIFKYVDELQEDLKNHPVVIASADNQELIDQVDKLLKEKYGNDLDITYVQVNPTAGAHCGPDTVGISFHAKHR